MTLLIFGGVCQIAAGDEPVPRERPTVSPSVRMPHLKPERAVQMARPYRYGNYYPWYPDDYFGYYGGFGFGWPYFPILGEIGRSTVWLAAGSGDYFGGGFRTRQPIEDTSFVYGVSASREQGGRWYSELDYKMTSVSPWLEWHGEFISVFAGFTKSTYQFEGE